MLRSFDGSSGAAMVLVTVFGRNFRFLSPELKGNLRLAKIQTLHDQKPKRVSDALESRAFSNTIHQTVGVYVKSLQTAQALISFHQ